MQKYLINEKTIIHFLGPNNNKYILLIVLLHVCEISLNSQDFSYIHYDVANGLPSNLVYCGLQDKRGIMWFGTDKGLSAFDNNKFQTYSINEGLPDSEIFNIWEDKNKNLWLTCFRNKPCYRKNRKFITSKKDKRLEKVNFDLGICNYFEKGNTIWLLGSEYKIYRMTDNNIESYNLPDAILYIKEINNSMWALATRSLMQINPIKPDSIYNFKNIYTGNQSTESIENLGSNILYSFRDRLVLYSVKNNIILKKDSIIGLSGRLAYDRENRFWVCSPIAGAICFDNNQNTLSNPKTILPNKKVTHMLEDNQGTYWFFTLDEGIFGLIKNPAIVYNKYNKLKSNNIISLIKNWDDKILVGDDEGHLSTISSRNVEIVEFKSIDGYNRIVNILPMKNGNLWISTDEGIYVQFPFNKSHKLDIQSSGKALLYQNDTIWCGTSSELYAISPATLEKRVILNQRITALGKDTEGTIWVGGIEGLYSSKDSFQFNYGKKFEMLQSRIIAIQGGTAGELWVATPENGLLKLMVNNGNIVKVTAINKLLNTSIDNIHSIFREINGRLWLSTNRGVYGINPRNWMITHYDHHYGLPNDDVRSVFVQSDTLWAGTASGVARILLHANSSIGEFPTYITSISYQHKGTYEETYLDDSIFVDNEIILPVNASLIKVNFTGLDYRSRGNLAFSCIITTVLPPAQWWTVHNLSQWIGNGFKGKPDTTLVKENFFDFGVNLSPGRYKIEATAITQNNVPSDHPDEWILVIPAKWYQTVWFSMLIWFLIAFAVYRIFKTRERLKNLVIAVAQSRLLALQAQINPHFIGNAINAVQRFFYPPNPTSASIYTATFTRLLRKTLDYSENTFITFQQELAYDRDYMNLARLRLGKEKFYYEINVEEPIPPNLLFPALFLQPILENATLHGISPEGICSVKIHFSHSGNYLVCTVIDNGPGINAGKTKVSNGKPHKSKGIEMLHKKAATLNQLFHLDLQLSIIDLTRQGPQFRGTKVTISFRTDVLTEVGKKQRFIDKEINKLIDP